MSLSSLYTDWRSTTFLAGSPCRPRSRGCASSPNKMRQRGRSSSHRPSESARGRCPATRGSVATATTLTICTTRVRTRLTSGTTDHPLKAFRGVLHVNRGADRRKSMFRRGRNGYVDLPCTTSPELTSSSFLHPSSSATSSNRCAGTTPEWAVFPQAQSSLAQLLRHQPCEEDVMSVSARLPHQRIARPLMRTQTSPKARTRSTHSTGARRHPPLHRELPKPLPGAYWSTTEV